MSTVMSTWQQTYQATEITSYMSKQPFDQL